jgi:hypothetical protein
VIVPAEDDRKVLRDLDGMAFVHLARRASRFGGVTEPMERQRGTVDLSLVAGKRNIHRSEVEGYGD